MNANVLPYWLAALPAVAFVLVVTGCSGGGGSDPHGGSNAGWDNQTNIEAIFETSCSGCHGTAWSTCWNVQASAATVESAVSSGAMPRSGPLSPSDKATLLAWLSAGAQCTGPREPPTQTFVAGGGAPVAGDPTH